MERLRVRTEIALARLKSEFQDGGFFVLRATCARLLWRWMDMLYSNINVSPHQIVHDMTEGWSNGRRRAVQNAASHTSVSATNCAISREFMVLMMQKLLCILAMPRCRHNCRLKGSQTRRKGRYLHLRSLQDQRLSAHHRRTREQVN